MPKPPTKKQHAYAKSIAQNRNESLPAGAELDAAICSAYIGTYKDASSLKSTPKPPSDRQTTHAGRIFAALSDSIGEQEFQLALTDAGRCSRFIQQYEDAYKERQAQEKERKLLDVSRDILNGLDVVPALLRQAISNASSVQEKHAVLSKHRAAGKGFSGLDPASLHSMPEKLTGYWLEGLQSTAFEGLGELENALGDDRRACFDLDDLQRALVTAPCEGLQPGEQPIPLRHIILKLVKEGKDQDPVVLSVLPISPVLDKDDPRGYRWGLAAERVPRFNRNQLGEGAKWPGLLLENVDAFDAWALEQVDGAKSDDAASALDLDAAFDLWDEAFNILSSPGEGPDSLGRGVQGWIARFMHSRHQHWQLKKRRPVFAMVDGSAASGTTRNVCAAYRQVLAEPALLMQPQLALFRQIAAVEAAPRQDYHPSDEAGKLGHLTSYGGHMDAFKNGQREAFPLDPAQRDALIALTTTGSGRLLAVNGPPGTGKTSLLRGVIASLWVEPLLSSADTPDCPLILACAATNQAVTNIISSFDETPGPVLFTGDDQLDEATPVSVDSRWLPHLVSYGWYAPANPEKDKGFQKYQLIGRQRPQLPWQFYGASSGLNNLPPEQAEGLYLACAERHFGAPMTLPKTLALLREMVKCGMQNLDAVMNAAEGWMQQLSAWVSTPAWTSRDDEQRHALRAQVAVLAGPSGRYAQCQLEAQQLDAALATLMSLQTYTGPIERQVDVLFAAEKDSGALDVQQYWLLKRLDYDLATLSERVEELRHATLLQRIKLSVATLLSPDEVQREWAALRDAIHACGLSVQGSGQPDFVAWAQAILMRRQTLRDELRIAAILVLHMRARELVTLPDDAIDGVQDWRDDLSRRIEHARARRAVLSSEMAQLQELYDRCLAELHTIDANYDRYANARTAVHSARDALITTLGALGRAVPDGDPVLHTLATALAAHSALDQPVLEDHQRTLVRHLQDWLDQKVRPHLFHLSARYWEGRYVQSRKETQVRVHDDTAYILSSQAQLRELAMLAPVFVVTAYSAPKLMRRHLVELESDMPPYLFGEADLLIVDEAGQGTPEVGASAFLFARRAIVVGDIEQLEPVWSLEEANDRQLVQRFGIGAAIAPDGDAYPVLQPAGVLMARGSVMRMAQRATWRTDPNAQAAGLTLTNHYRCLKPIIEICNRMVYRGALRVATRSPDQLWRPELARLGYLVIDTVADTKNPGGSRRNLAEATCIARWLKENEASLRQHFDPTGKKDLADLVAIVTPFKGQKAPLKAALAKEYGVHKPDPSDKAALYNRMVIDTVHSLQGAERPVVIFSMVESSVPSERQFYDKGTNLINVAISRAKELFIVAMAQPAVDYAYRLTAATVRKPSDYLWQAVVQKGSRLNARHVVVVESPNKRETIHAALGGSLEWEIIDTNGHITDLADPDQWDISQASEPIWGELEPGGGKALARLQQLWLGMATLYLATDPDPEGEAIAWHILRILQERHASGEMEAPKGEGPAVKRMRFHRLEPHEIQRAMREASNGLDAGLVKSALARNFLDRLIATQYPQRLGMTSAPEFTTGIGRVQLGILDLVDQANQHPDQYRIQVRIPVTGGAPLTAYLANRGQQGMGNMSSWPHFDKAISDLEKLQAVLAHPNATVTATWTGRLHQHPPYPAINTARFLALAYRALGMLPAQAMAELQALYEGTAQRATAASPSRHATSIDQAAGMKQKETIDE